MTLKSRLTDSEIDVVAEEMVLDAIANLGAGDASQYLWDEYGDMTPVVGDDAIERTLDKLKEARVTFS